MYSLKPVTITDDVPIPDVMYRLKSYHETTETSGVSQENFEALEKRQDSILEQLKELKAEVDDLVNRSSSSKPSGDGAGLFQTKISPCPSFKKGEVIEDIVITANPGRPPLSVILLCDMLAQQYQVFTTCYTHSSVGELVEKMKTALPASNGLKRNAADMAISLTWAQDTPRPKLSVSNTTIEGEAVIARYLTRLLKQQPPNFYESDNLASVTTEDFWLDLQSDITHGDKNKQDAVLDVLQKNFTSAKPFLGGIKSSLADMVLWSALVQMKPDTKLPSAVTSWLQRCSNLAEFQPAVNML